MVDWRIGTVAVAVSLVIGVPSPGGAQPDDPTSEDQGIPVTSPVVRRTCGACHQRDAEGRMTRISYQRGTPEGWQQTIRRMVLLNGLQIEATDAREAVRYLANQHGLAPEEARPVAFEVERRMIDHVYEADPETQVTCTKCHSLGRVISQRRSREAWELLVAMHQGYYPLTDFQSFYGRGAAPPPGPDGKPRYPVDKALDHLSAAFPLVTPEWTAWSANRSSARLAGTWALAGSEPGKGRVYGTAELTAVTDAPDEYQTRVTYVYARTGESVSRTGRALVYTGFQWRGRSETSSGETLREVMFVERNQQLMSGRWFAGDHDEFGLDVTLTRAGSRPAVSGVYPLALRRSAGDVSLTLYGANLPSGLTAADLDLGPGIEITEVVDGSSTTAVLRATVAAEAAVGARDLFLGDAFVPNAVAVYDRVDRMTVTPATGMARVGGVAFPKRHEQFEARGYHNGADGQPDTADDLDLGLIDVEWALEEYAVTFGEDDIEFVGLLDGEGLFTPAVDGPNPERVNENNNVGDVWVVATSTEPNEGDAASQPLRARTCSSPCPSTIVGTRGQEDHDSDCLTRHAQV